MLISNYNKSNGNRVRFISYTGRYPNLCSGVLTLEIDGKEYKFGHDYSYYHYDANGNGRFTDEAPDNPNFEKFWSSGGRIAGGMEDLYAVEGEWHIDADDLPEQFRDIADEIDEVFNNNVPWGCCGGCI